MVISSIMIETPGVCVIVFLNSTDIDYMGF